MNIAVKNITVLIAAKTVFSDFSVAFAPTGISFILGENGAGKTQLLRCLHDLATPQQGRVVAPPQYQQAYLSQTPQLLNRSVLANLRFIRGSAVSTVAHFDKYLPQVVATLSLQALLPERVASLSGGQKKRVALARLLLQQATCWLLDEPTANLDNKSNIALEQIVNNKVAAGDKVIIATHDYFHLQRLFVVGRDELLVLKDGKLLTRSQALDLPSLSRHL